MIHERIGGYNVPLEVNPFLSGQTLVDCGDIPLTPYVCAASAKLPGLISGQDKDLAIAHIEEAHKTLLHRTPATALGINNATGKPLVPVSADGKHHPRLVTLGGRSTSHGQPDQPLTYLTLQVTTPLSFLCCEASTAHTAQFL